MNTIERVARKLAFAEGHNPDEELIFNFDDGSEVKEPHWKAYENRAHWALEALCEGLEWFGAGESSLRWNGRQIGWIQCWCWEPDKWQVHFMGDFHKVSTREEARAALMSAARNWIMGE